MKPVSLAVVGPCARRIGEQLVQHGGFAIKVDASSFTQLVSETAFPTRYVVMEASPDRACTRARVAISQSLGVRVLLIAPSRAGAESGAEIVVDGGIAVETIRAIEAAEREARESRPRRTAAASLTPITPREQEAIELWVRVGRIPLVAEQMSIEYTTAATLIKRARKKLAQSAPGAEAMR